MTISNSLLLSMLILEGIQPNLLYIRKLFSFHANLIYTVVFRSALMSLSLELLVPFSSTLR
jgi:hypothetical protein